MGIFDRNAPLVKALEKVPGVNLGVAIGHAAACNSKQASRACVSGFAVGAGVAAGVVGGPVAGVAVGAGLTGAGAALDDQMKEKEDL